MEDRKIIEVSIDSIIPNPYQPRKIFSKDTIEELSESIKLYGILQPITIRMLNENQYELIAGERRLRAAKLAGFEKIPAILNNMSDETSAVLALIENLQREDLNFIEEAKGYESLINHHSFTQQELAEKIGKNQSTIANKLRILKLNDDIKDKLLSNDLTERHARALLKLPTDELKAKVLDIVIRNELNVKKTEKIIQEILDKELENKEPEKKRKIKAALNYRIYLNTLKSAYNAIINTGISANYKEIDRGDYIEVVVKIPKS